MHYSKLLAALAAMAAPAVGALADTSVQQLTPTSVEVTYDDGGRMLVDFYGPNIFRLFRDPAGGEVRDPKANPPAQILVDNPRIDPGELTVTSDGGVVSVATPRVRIDFASDSDAFTVTDLTTGHTVIETVGGTEFTPGRSTSLTLTEQPGEYFYGGGVQNGRFSHKGKVIDIRNTNSWTDGGVASPTPFYWSTGGYGAMWHTFAPGAYDFGATTPGRVQISHESPYLDLFLMVDKEPVALLNDFYQLTGNPVLLPKFGFYEGHLNAYNRDYWREDENGILFEDGKHYRESQKDNGGIKESLNGELPGNYQFSARAVIDRYADADMPLGWVLPNDGYGAGYGQTSTLEGNVANLKEFGDYARSKGVEIGLWTQSDLHPVEGIEPLLQRDIVREVRDAGVRVLKTAVAWVGAGYSFGLNGVADVAAIMPEY
ncbi:MAG: alpha-xylosidase, partial [Muribaculaceae bacterium]|nr:alpha-xylosidase [Muribaculaceae bacterium]